MKKHGFELRDSGHLCVVTLATGESLRLSFTERMGCEGFGLMVHGEINGRSVAIPMASNALAIMSEESIAAERAAVDEAVRQRKKRTGS